jgi:integrase
MARKTNVIPSYLLHKQSGQARVRVNGRDVLLGEFNSKESRVRYAEIVAQFANGQIFDKAPPRKGRVAPSDPGLTVNELVVAYLAWADGHFVKAGQPTSEIHCLKSAVKPFIDLFGFTSCDEFGPLGLKTVRERMVQAGWCRKTVNKNTGRIRSIFRWGVENEMVQPTTLQKLQAVAPLLQGRTKAHDNAPRKPAVESQVEAVRPFVSSLVWDLVQFQRLTGCRAGEALSLTPAKLERSAAVWLFAVDGHKTEHHGHARIVAIGPKCQAILQPRLDGVAVDEAVFPIRRDSYTLAIRRACEKYNRRNPAAPIEPWTPHQLRHAKAHEVREKFGLEHVQATLGHAEFSMAERYAQATLARAVEAAEAVG